MKTALVAVVAAMIAVGGPSGASAELSVDRHVRVLILNGTHRVGLAERVSVQLARRDFVMQRLRGHVANAPTQVALTQIAFDPAQPGAFAAARHVRGSFGRDVVIGRMTGPLKRLAAAAGRPTVVIVLGSTFRHLR